MKLLAKDAVDGQPYNLPERGQLPAYRGAVCNGWNHTKQWLLFLVSDERGKRKLTMVAPTQMIETIQAFY